MIEGREGSKRGMWEGEGEGGEWFRLLGVLMLGKLEFYSYGWYRVIDEFYINFFWKSYFRIIE